MKNCKTLNCGNKANHGRYCKTCVGRRYAENNPIRNSYRILKQNAKRRGKEFSLTFKQFKEFAIKTDYLNGKGRNKTGFHIDRRREEDGYTMDNIQVLTNSQNVKKYIYWSGRKDGNNFFKTETIKNTEYENSLY